jgi:hypothetical protein
MKLASKQSVYLGRAATSEEGEAGDGEGDMRLPRNWNLQGVCFLEDAAMEMKRRGKRETATTT